MAYFTWDESYSLNIDKIDRQHKKLFEVISDFYNTLRSHDEKAYIALLDSLIEYAVQHFEDEEALLAKYNYPDTKEHLEEHHKFQEKVLYIKERIDHGGLVIPTEITGYLKDWLSKHINGSDKKYAKYLHEQGFEVE